jgi:hypothetical protein
LTDPTAPRQDPVVPNQETLALFHALDAAGHEPVIFAEGGTESIMVGAWELVPLRSGRWILRNAPSDDADDDADVVEHIAGDPLPRVLARLAESR